MLDPRGVMLGGAALCVMLGFASPAAANHAINWYAFTGGGSAHAAGGPYVLRGTIGQPDAGVHSAGFHSLRGGFWVVVNATYLVDVDPTETPPVPPHLALDAPQPNPLITRTWISFALPHDAIVRMKLYDAAGRVVRTLADERFEAGRHARIWDGTDSDGQRLAAGIYFLRFESGALKAQRRLVLLR